MQYTYTRALNDDELLAHLQSQDHVLLRVPGLRWQEVERQVERLGFGEAYFVAETQGSRGACCRIEPFRARAALGVDGLRPVLES